MIAHITPGDLKAKLDQDQVILIDVREENEWNYCRIEGAEHIPLRRIQQTEIDPEPGKDIVLYCHSGQRSFFAAQILQQRGLDNVYNLQGGIDAYSVQIDPSIPRY